MEIEVTKKIKAVQCRSSDNIIEFLRESFDVNASYSLEYVAERNKPHYRLWVDNYDGTEKRIIEIGDWLINDPEHGVCVISNADFEKRYGKVSSIANCGNSSDKPNRSPKELWGTYKETESGVAYILIADPRRKAMWS